MGMERFRAAGIPVTLHAFRSRVDLPSIRRLRERIRSGRYDILHAFSNRALANTLIASRRVRPRRIVAYRGTSGHLSRLDPASWLTYLNPGVDRIACVSDAVRQYLESRGVPPRRLRTIYKGHDVAWYRPAPRGALREFGVPDEAFVLGFAGNMRPVKGVDVLLRAALALPPSRPVHLLLMGEVRDRRVEQLARAPGLRDRVHLAGHRPDAASLSGACDAVVMPSIAREGLPRAVIEAMAQGVAPIVSAVGGMPELVVDGECGLVVPPSDPAALADAIVRLARDPGLRRRYGRAARQRIVEHFNIDKTVAETAALYESLL
jgi:glycosyltransferase involved in cell wall biosynthesis